MHYSVWLQQEQHIVATLTVVVVVKVSLVDNPAVLVVSGNLGTVIASRNNGVTGNAVVNT